MGRMKGILGILTLAVAGQAAAAEQICNLAFQACPKTLEGTTINVPEDVIWLEPKLPFCTEQVQVQTGSQGPTPSIVFVIDNSGSMGERLNDGTDPQGARFSVTNTLLDSIFKAAPATEVGLVIFSRRLSFDHRENPFFKTAFPNDTSQHDSYVPLTRLNQAFANGRTGLDTLKSLLSTEPGSNGDLIHRTRLPGSRVGQGAAATDPTNVRHGTDISLGFQAAKLAIQDSKAAKENQYIIFLSDGEPTAYDEGRQQFANHFRDSVAGTPTTFTVYFRPGTNPQVPATIRVMTENIRANGYSTSNPRSNYWAINVPASQLLTLMQTNILNPIFANVPAQAQNVTVVSGATNLNSSQKDGTGFILPERVPLQPNQTSVAMTYTFTYTDSGKQKTTTATYNVNIRRVPAGTPPEGVTTVCKDAGDITLSHKGTPVTIVTADHENLDVKLILPGGEVCADCKVTIQPHANRTGKDSETVPVAPSGGTSYTGKFDRETSTTPVGNDGKLQHLTTDSIVVVWVNPQNPLDVIRKAFPYRDVRTALEVAPHNTYSRTDNSVPMSQRTPWLLVGSTTVRITPEGGASDCCRLISTLPPQDSIKYVGIKITASRSFRLDLKVYDNLGQYVNQLSFTVPQAEFNNLPRVGTTGNNRSLLVLWDARTEQGNLAGTGAYIFKSAVTLLRVPGIAEDEVVETDHRLVGVVRDR